MNALRKLHTALRPRGVLLDIHPEPQDAPVEVWRGDQTISVGREVHTQQSGEITSAQAALRRVVAEGRFILEREVSFDFLRHFDSVDTWLAYRIERQTSSTVDDEVLARSRTLLAQAPGELIVRRRVQATRYRKV